jgi:hypothetical protein
MDSSECMRIERKKYAAANLNRPEGREIKNVIRYNSVLIATGSTVDSMTDKQMLMTCAG